MGDPRPPVYPISQSPRSSRGQGYQLHPGLGDPTDKGSVRGAPGPQFVGTTPGQEAPRYSRPSSTRRHCAQTLISLPHQSRPLPRGEGSGPRVSGEQNQPRAQSRHRRHAHPSNHMAPGRGLLAGARRSRLTTGAHQADRRSAGGRLSRSGSDLQLTPASQGKEKTESHHQGRPFAFSELSLQGKKHAQLATGYECPCME